MDARQDLGSFLQSRRSRLRPEDVGLVAYGERRRVPGLRREELAQLAGVSVSYYTRLEQGQTAGVSDEVLLAVGRVLRLDEIEQAHLRNLARPPRPSRRATTREQVRPGLRRLITALDDVPVILLGRATHVLCWNRLGHALLFSHLPADRVDAPNDRINMTWSLFLDPQVRSRYVDWDVKARSAVAHLRLLAGETPDDRYLTSLIGELLVKDPDFASLWSAHPVQTCEPTSRVLKHPTIGEIEVSQEVLMMPADAGQLLVTFTAPDAVAAAQFARLRETAMRPEDAVRLSS